MALKLKPYPAYKESGEQWLGKIPSHWGILPNRALFSEVKQRNHPEEQLLSVTIGKGVILQKDLLSNTSKKDASNENKSNYKLVCPRDLAYNKMRAWQGAIGVSDYRGIVSPAYVVIRPRTDCNPRYFNYLFRTPMFAKEAERWSYGITSDQWSLRAEDFRRIHCLMPPIGDQGNIVNIVTYIDNLINLVIRSKRRLIKLLNEQKQAIVHHAVTRGLDPNVRLQPSGIEWLGDVPEHWEVKRIKQVAGIVRGKFSHRPRNDPDFYDGAYPFIQTGDLSRATKFVTKYGQTLNDRGLAISKMFASGTLAMTIAANIGDVAVLSFDACFPDSIVGFETYPLMNRDYLYYVFSCMKQEFLREAPVNTQGNLNVERLGTQTVACPPLSEQQKIVINIEGKIKSLGECIDNFRLEIDLLREYRTRLIADVVTGKLDVTGVELTETGMEMDFGGDSEVNEREIDGYDDMDEAVISDE